MKKHLLYISIISVFLFTACSDEFDLEKSVFINDTEHPNLPQYSEWGYNTFGAFYDRKVFISNDQEIPLKVIATGNTTTFIFKGQLNEVSSYNYGNSYYDSDMSIKFNIDNFIPTIYSDLLALNDSLFDLQHPDCSITILIDNNTYDATIINGEFEFIKAQKLIVDTEEVQIILSGVFDLQVLINNEPISISYGRFDMGVGEDNFFAY
ncbi:hypothetical protein ACFLS4_03895 [Bacteroidota bacterium]